MGLANQLTIFRILLVPVFIIFIGYNKPLYALITFFIAGLTDALDGFVARRFNQVTTLGKILDPIADKTLIISSFIFIYNSEMAVKFPFWYVVLVISRDIYIIAGSVLIYFLKGGLEVKPTIFGKATTFFQILSVIVILTANIIPIDKVYVEGTILTATFFTVLSALTYFYEGVQKFK